MRQLNKHEKDNFKLSAPATRGDPLLKQLEGNKNFQILNLKPPASPEKLRNIFESFDNENKIKQATVKFPSEHKQKVILLLCIQLGPGIIDLDTVYWGTTSVNFIHWQNKWALKKNQNIIEKKIYQHT